MSISAEGRTLGVSSRHLRNLIFKEYKKQKTEIEAELALIREADSDGSTASVTATPNVQSIVKEIVFKIKKIEIKIGRLNDDQAMAKIKIKEICKILSALISSEENKDFKFPITNNDQLIEYEEKIRESTEYARNLMLYFRSQFKDLRHMMLSVFDLKMLSEYNLSGKCSKKPFAKLEISKVMREACKESNSEDFQENMRFILKKAHSKEYKETYKAKSQPGPSASNSNAAQTHFKTEELLVDDSCDFDEDYDDDETSS